MGAYTIKNFCNITFEKGAIRWAFTLFILGISLIVISTYFLEDILSFTSGSAANIEGALASIQHANYYVKVEATLIITGVILIALSIYLFIRKPNRSDVTKRRILYVFIRLKNNKFLKALIPIWIVHLILEFSRLILDGAILLDFIQLSWNESIFIIISYVLLPFFAGFQIGRYGGKMGTAILGAISIPLLSIIVFVIWLLNSYTDTFYIQEIMFEFKNYIIHNTLVFSLVPQVVLGGLGHIVAHKLKAK